MKDAYDAVFYIALGFVSASVLFYFTNPACFS